MLSELRQKKLMKWFEIYDADGDGVITKKDFAQFVMTTAANLAIKPGAPEYRQLQGHEMAFFHKIRAICGMENDGHLTPDQWLAAMDQFLNRRGEYESIIEPALAYWLRFLDWDQNGRMSRERYIQHQMSLGSAHDAAESAFHRLDVNGSGYLSVDAIMKNWRDFFYSEDPKAPGNGILGPLH